MANLQLKYITIMVTSRCNLACLYCYSQYDRYKDKTIDIRFAKRGIDDFFQSNPDREIRFFGSGDPVTRLDVVKEIASYTRNKWGRDVKLSIQTNGFFSQPAAKWIGENLNEIWISCDGPSAIQDLHRPTLGGTKSSEIVERNIKYFIQETDITLGIRATVTQFSYNRQLEILDYFYNLGVETIWADHMTSEINEIRGIHKPDYLEYAQNYLEAFKKARELGIFFGCYFMSNFDKKVEYNCRACVPYPHLTEDGLVSCCDMAYSKLQRGVSELFYGYFDDNKGVIIYEGEKIAKLRKRTAENMYNCRGCEALYHCAGACMGETLRETGNVYGIRPNVCEAIRFLAKNIPLNDGLGGARHS